MRKTTEQAAADLHEAWGRLVDAMVESLRLEQLVRWLDERLR